MVSDAPESIGGQIREELRETPARVEARVRVGRRLDCDAPTGKRGELIPHALEEFPVSLEGVLLGDRELEGERQEQPLRPAARPAEGRHRPLVQDALVRGVLVHERERLALLEDDIGVEHLQERRCGERSPAVVAGCEQIERSPAPQEGCRDSDHGPSTPSGAAAATDPRARRTASSTPRSTMCRSRKRTSSFAGWTLTSTASPGRSIKRKTDGRSPGATVERYPASAARTRKRVADRSPRARGRTLCGRPRLRLRGALREALHVKRAHPVAHLEQRVGERPSPEPGDALDLGRPPLGASIMDALVARDLKEHIGPREGEDRDRFDDGSRLASLGAQVISGGLGC